MKFASLLLILSSVSAQAKDVSYSEHYKCLKALSADNGKMVMDGDPGTYFVMTNGAVVNSRTTQGFFLYTEKQPLFCSSTMTTGSGKDKKPVDPYEVRITAAGKYLNLKVDPKNKTIAASPSPDGILSGGLNRMAVEYVECVSASNGKSRANSEITMLMREMKYPSVPAGCENFKDNLDISKDLVDCSGNKMLTDDRCQQPPVDVPDSVIEN